MIKSAALVLLLVARLSDQVSARLALSSNWTSFEISRRRVLRDNFERVIKSNRRLKADYPWVGEYFPARAVWLEAGHSWSTKHVWVDISADAKAAYREIRKSELRNGERDFLSDLFLDHHRVVLEFLSQLLRGESISEMQSASCDANAKALLESCGLAEQLVDGRKVFSPDKVIWDGLRLYKILFSAVPPLLSFNSLWEPKLTAAGRDAYNQLKSAAGWQRGSWKGQSPYHQQRVLYPSPIAPPGLLWPSSKYAELSECIWPLPVSYQPNNTSFLGEVLFYQVEDAMSLPRVGLLQPEVAAQVAYVSGHNLGESPIAIYRRGRNESKWTRHPWSLDPNTRAALIRASIKTMLREQHELWHFLKESTQNWSRRSELRSVAQRLIAIAVEECKVSPHTNCSVKAARFLSDYLALLRIGFDFGKEEDVSRRRVATAMIKAHNFVAAFIDLPSGHEVQKVVKGLPYAW